ncbi:MAG: tripartite tricarboxylate transporter substrate binding protein [Proteobacteria bacterium]|nr:tripartite tricarboxylate transporter substrate binding protein [Burkholderiales bacterium]
MNRRVCATATCALLAACAWLGPSGSHAQPFPSKPIRIVVTYAPGGGADVLARIVAEQLGPRIGQAVLVENRPGAGGTIGAAMVAKAPPDGYTLLLADIAPNAIAPGLYSRLPYDALKDFEPITQAVRVPLIMVASPAAPFANVTEMLAWSRVNPGKLTYATSGNGSVGHLAGALLEHQASLKVQHVPYKGGSALLVDVVGGRVDIGFVSLASALGQIQAGKLQVVGVAGQQRPATMPAIQSIADAGIAGYEVSTWFGFAAPAGTPREIVDRLQREIVDALRPPAVLDKLRTQGMELLGSTPDAFRAYMASEIARWAQVVKLAGIKPE